MDAATAQYLNRHAEPEAKRADAVERRFGHVLTIPATGELDELLKLLDEIPQGTAGDVLVICIVNARANTPVPLRDANHAVLSEIHHRFGPGAAIGDGSVWFERPHGALWLFDRASSGRELPDKQGVGLARKIGADIALALDARGRLASDWIHCTDADARLPADYFTRTRSVSADAVALVYPFVHVSFRDGRPGDDAAGSGSDVAPAGRAADEYEIWLRYYVAGLHYAESPYAFHTIGSTLAVRTFAYAGVRGFPKRLAAEDFYLLNKLAKLGPVQSLDGAPIALSNRPSERVPFGTGRAMIEARKIGSRRLYHPAIFENLRVWQRTLREIADARPKDPRQALRTVACGADTRSLEAALDASGAFDAASPQARDRNSRLRQLHEHFDAAWTLKLVHALRDQAFGSLSIGEAVSRALFVEWDGNPADRDGILAALDRPGWHSPE